jgi:hypothetical protein
MHGRRMIIRACGQDGGGWGGANRAAEGRKRPVGGAAIGLT